LQFIILYLYNNYGVYNYIADKNRQVLVSSLCQQHEVRRYKLWIAITGQQRACSK